MWLGRTLGYLTFSKNKQTVAKNLTFLHLFAYYFVQLLNGFKCVYFSS